MPVTETILAILQLDTFSNIWYWLAVAVTWAVVSHWVLGVPFDMIIRARRRSSEALDDLEAIVDLHVRRFIMIDDMAGTPIVGLFAFVLTVLAIAGFYYEVEFAQGVFLIGFPLCIVGAVCQHACRKYQRDPPGRENLVAELMRLRIIIQVIAMIAIFVTAFYGMYYTLSVPEGF
ncbi:MAG: hypothetical protein AAFP85_18130 [Pseudomonadota bacterium]